MSGHIFLITVDSLRRDAVSCYGDKTVTPNIASVAEDSLVFDSTVSQGPYTATAFPSILFSNFMINYHRETYRAEGVSLAERMKEKGYNTAGVHTNPYTSAQYGYSSGFDVFEEFEEEVAEMNGFVDRVKSALSRSRRARKISRQLYMKYNYLQRKKPYLDGQKIFDTVLDTLTEENWFVWAHFMDTHYPYMTFEGENNTVLSRLRQARLMSAIKSGENLRPEQETEVQNLYLGTVKSFDERLGEFVRSLKERGLYRDSTIILTADHGEEFGEHGGYLHEEKLYDELIHVPLIVKPAGNKSGRVKGVTELRDLHAIIQKACEGDAFKPERDYAISGCGTHIDGKKMRRVAVRDRQQKVIVNEDKENEYYDLTEDSEEQENRIDDASEHEFINTAERVLDQLDEGEIIDKDVETKRRLRELGYF